MYKLTPVPSTFRFEGQAFLTIDEMKNLHSRCLAIPLGKPGAPRWFSDEQISKATHISQGDDHAGS